MFFVSIAHTPFDAAIFSNASLLVIGCNLFSPVAGFIPILLPLFIFLSLYYYFIL
jgi:hypothetical protein